MEDADIPDAQLCTYAPVHDKGATSNDSSYTSSGLSLAFFA